MTLLFTRICIYSNKDLLLYLVVNNIYYAGGELISFCYTSQYVTMSYVLMYVYTSTLIHWSNNLLVLALLSFRLFSCILDVADGFHAALYNSHSLSVLNLINVSCYLLHPRVPSTEPIAIRRPLQCVWDMPNQIIFK